MQLLHLHAPEVSRREHFFVCQVVCCRRQWPVADGLGASRRLRFLRLVQLQQNSLFASCVFEKGDLRNSATTWFVSFSSLCLSTAGTGRMSAKGVRH